MNRKVDWGKKVSGLLTFSLIRVGILVLSRHSIWLGFLACAIYRSWTPFKEHSQHQLRACRHFAFNSFCEIITLHSANIFSLFSPVLRWGKERKWKWSEYRWKVLLTSWACLDTHPLGLHRPLRDPLYYNEKPHKVVQVRRRMLSIYQAYLQAKKPYRLIHKKNLTIQVQPEYISPFNAVSMALHLRRRRSSIVLVVPFFTGSSLHR